MNDNRKGTEMRLENVTTAWNEQAVHSKFLLDWLESCGESWVIIIRCYDMHGKVYFRVKACSASTKRPVVASRCAMRCKPASINPTQS